MEATAPLPSIAEQLRATPIIPASAMLVDIEGLRGVVKWAASRSLDTARGELDVANQRALQKEREFRTVLTDRDSKQRALVAIERSLEDTATNVDPVLHHLRGLLTSERYKDFSFNAGFINAITSYIFIRQGSTVYSMGSYKVKVDVRDLSVKFLGFRDNLSPEGYIHPHISDGNPCWGNVAAEVPKMIAAGNFGALFEVVHDFLSSYNKESPYRNLRLWPEVKSNLPAPVTQLVPVLSETGDSDEGEVVVVLQGPFSQLARTESTFTTSDVTVNYAPVQVTEVPIMFSERIDRDLRSRGLLTTNLSRHQRQTLQNRLVGAEGTPEYHRLLRYYISWLRRTS